MRPSVGTVSINMIERRGIWLKMTGDLVDGAIDQLTSRLGRLATLGFQKTIIDVRSVHHIDHAGSDVIVAFTNDLLRDGGTVQAIDSTRLLERSIGSIPTGLTVSEDSPDGSWWL